MEFFKYKMMKITVICLIILFIIILCFPFAYSTVKPDKGTMVNEGVNQGVNQGINNSNVVQEEQVVSEESDKQVQEEIAEDINSEEHKSESSYNFRAHIPVSKEPVQESEETDIDLEVDSN